MYLAQIEESTEIVSTFDTDKYSRFKLKRQGAQKPSVGLAIISGKGIIM